MAAAKGKPKAAAAAAPLTVADLAEKCKAQEAETELLRKELQVRVEEADKYKLKYADAKRDCEALQEKLLQRSSDAEDIAEDMSRQLKRTTGEMQNQVAEVERRMQTIERDADAAREEHRVEAKQLRARLLATEKALKQKEYDMSHLSIEFAAMMQQLLVRMDRVRGDVDTTYSARIRNEVLPQQHLNEQEAL